MEGVKYPKEVYTAMTANKVLSITGHFLPIETDKGLSPYKIYQPGKSRFVFSIVNTKENTYPAGNIRIEEVAGILANTRSAHQIDMFANLPVMHQMFTGIKEIQKMVQGVQEGIRMVYNFVRTGSAKIDRSKQKQTSKTEVDAPLAKSVIIGNGKLKGKTPYQVITEDATQIVDLKSQYKWLEKNLERYPDNKKQMDAIQEAVSLFEAGKIVVGDQSSGEKLNFGSVALYKPSPRALVREKDDKGYCPVYEVAINWHIGERYPVEVRVKRYKAPVVKKETGVINPQRSEAIEVVENNFRLTSSQWMDCTRLMESNMNRFEQIMALQQFREAEEADRANREIAKK